MRGVKREMGRDREMGGVIARWGVNREMGGPRVGSEDGRPERPDFTSSVFVQFPLFVVLIPPAGRLYGGPGRLRRSGGSSAG